MASILSELIGSRSVLPVVFLVIIALHRGLPNCCSLVEAAAASAESVIKQEKSEIQKDQVKVSVSLNSSPAAPLVQEKTADLTVLINETLAINKKSPSLNHTVLLNKDEQWTFDRVEYDLMEFLQDLSARYKLSNESTTPDPTTTKSPPVVLMDDESPLDAKSVKVIIKEEVRNNVKTNLTNPQAGSPTAASEIQATILRLDEEKVKKILNVTADRSTSNPSTTTTLTPSTSVQEASSTVILEKAKSPMVAESTKIPQLSGISLASGEPEIAESSWQYGIFDRFTRPKTTSTSTTPEPRYDSSGKMDTRAFNSDECGLRVYDEPLPQHSPDIFSPDLSGEASKELNQRRQRPPSGVVMSVIGQSKKNMNQIQDESMIDRVTDERDAYESYKDHMSSAMEDEFAAESDEGQPGSVGQPFDGTQNNQPNNQNSGYLNHQGGGDFNLASRRHWLQQQLERTLELLGFNSSAQSAAEFLNQTSGLSLNTRENMMKKSGKLGKMSFQDEVLTQEQQEAGKSTESKLLKPDRHDDDMKLEARVIGGSDARLGDSPWSVSLQALVSKPGTVGVEYRHYCGGTIISDYYVLTAAHCLDFMVGRESRLFVVVGDLNWRMSTASLYGRRFGIEKLIIHSGYKSTAFGHDIGLIKTKESMRPLKVNGRYIINSVCLPEKGVEHSGEAELVGWGLFSNRNEMADTLQVADVPILPRPLCVDLYKRRTGLIQWLIGIELITDKQVCAGTFGRGICQGDSGSALVVNEKFSRRHSSHLLGVRQKALTKKSKRLRSGEHTRATIIGIVAFGGIRRCSYQSLPGVYMQTSKYMDWILPRIQT